MKKLHELSPSDKPERVDQSLDALRDMTVPSLGYTFPHLVIYHLWEAANDSLSHTPNSCSRHLPSSSSSVCPLTTVASPYTLHITPDNPLSTPPSIVKESPFGIAMVTVANIICRSLYPSPIRSNISIYCDNHCNFSGGYRFGCGVALRACECGFLYSGIGVTRAVGSAARPR